MSLNRFAAKRDDNEPAIRKRFAHHGWHTEQLSGAGMPDLLCWPPDGHRAFARGCPSTGLVDVKMPKGKVTPQQVEKWTALHAMWIPVYVVRTEADVDALVGGTLEPWEPATTERDVLNALHRAVWPSKQRKPRRGYIPPRSTPVDAAKEAEETFAPPVHFEHCHVFAGSWCTCRAGQAKEQQPAPPSAKSDDCTMIDCGGCEECT